MHSKTAQMKAYIIINGKKTYIKNFKNKKEAYFWAQNYCNHSKEVLIRRVKTVSFGGKKWLEERLR